MMSLVAAVVLLVLGGLLFWTLTRNIELARLHVRHGTTEFVRGRLPAKLLGNMRDVLTSAHVDEAEIRIVVEDARPRLVARGVNDATAQQLRNVVGAYTVGQIRAGRAAR